MAKRDRKVHVLILSHRHGTDYHVAETEELAFRLLYAYVERWWDDGADAPKMPKNRDKAIEFYFDEIRDDENYEIEEITITTEDNVLRHEKGLV